MSSVSWRPLCRLTFARVCWLFWRKLHYPLAVRSSSLLEDSQYQPFTGVYETFMLSNHHPDLHERLNQLSEAIKRVYASTFSERAKAYVRATPYRLEEEKMAVIIQQVVGAMHGDAFLSGLFRRGSIAAISTLSLP